MVFKRVPRWYLVTLGQQYNVGEKPIVILNTYASFAKRVFTKPHSAAGGSGRGPSVPILEDHRYTGSKP